MAVEWQRKYEIRLYSSCSMAGMEKSLNRFIIAEECQAIFHV